MSDRPTAAELVEAVAEFLSEEVLPAATDHRLKFRTLVALNALAIASREVAGDELSLGHEDVAELARQIRAGNVDDETLPLLKAHVAEKLRISNPAYLDRYR